MNRKRIVKADLWLIGLLLLIGILSLLAVSARTKEGAVVQVTVDGVVYGTYSLSEKQDIPIEIAGTVTNQLQIANGRADMIEANCPDQLCVHQKAISKQGETIVCLPNRVVAEVQDDSEAAFDSISR